MTKNISPTSSVSQIAKIGQNVQIGHCSVVHDNVIIGDNVVVGAFCELGVSTPFSSGGPLIIGANSLIRSHSTFYESSFFGAGLTTGHHVVVRENTHVGKAFQLGTFSEIQGDCEIGDYVRFQSNVFVGKKTKLGNFVWIFPYVILTNDPTPPSNSLIGCVIEDFAAIGAASTILPGVKIGSNVFIGANSCVTRDVADDMFAIGSPAITKGLASKILLHGGGGKEAYPWRKHFTRGYPAEVIEGWFLEDGDNGRK